MTSNSRNNQRAGMAFRKRRKELDLTLEQMRYKTGITTVSLSKLELGQIGEPQLRFTVQYGMALGFAPLEVLQLYGLDVSVPEAEKGMGEIIYYLLLLPENKRKELIQAFKSLLSTAIS